MRESRSSRVLAEQTLILQQQTLRLNVTIKIGMTCLTVWFTTLRN